MSAWGWAGVGDVRLFACVGRFFEWAFYFATVEQSAGDVGDEVVPSGAAGEGCVANAPTVMAGKAARAGGFDGVGEARMPGSGETELWGVVGGRDTRTFARLRSGFGGDFESLIDTHGLRQGPNGLWAEEACDLSVAGGMSAVGVEASRADELPATLSQFATIVTPNRGARDDQLVVLGNPLPECLPQRSLDSIGRLTSIGVGVDW